METNKLGRWYKDREDVVKQGEEGVCMYVLQQGKLEVIDKRSGQEFCLRILEAGDIFGEMALFEKEVRSATVRASGEAQVLTLDKRTLLRRIKEDPLVALHILEVLSHRIRTLSTEYVILKDKCEEQKRTAVL